MKQNDRMKITRGDNGFISLETSNHNDKSRVKTTPKGFNSAHDDKPLMLSSHGENSSNASDISRTSSSTFEYAPYVFPTNPTYFDYIFFVPNAIRHSIKNMILVFGWKFVLMIIIVYGLQQGMGNAFFFFARDYYFKDVEKLEPADAQTYIAVSMTPWNIKPLYGMLSDSIAILGYHRIPYIIMAGAGGGVSLLMLSIIPLTAFIAVTLMIFVNISVASPDVMIDGVIAEKVKSHPKFATDLQSLCWGSQSLFAIAGHLSSGVAVKQFGSRAIFGGLVVAALAITLPAVLNWLGEVPDKIVMNDKAGSGSAYLCCWNIFKLNFENFYTHKEIFVLAIVVSVLALAMSCCALFISHWLPRLIIVLCIATMVASSVWFSLRKTLPDVARAALFIFLANCMTPDIDTAMFYWITDDPGGPQFDPPFMGFISAGSFAAMFMGVLLYNYYFSTWSYKSIFSFALVSLALTNVFDVILVERWNLRVGIPDKMLALGDSALSPVARRLFALPMVILAAKVCPSGAEATLFAMMMSLSNFGSAVSVYLGALLLMSLGIESGNYSNLTWAICIKACCRLTPLLLIPILIPSGSPSDPSELSTDLSTNGSIRSDKDLETSNPVADLNSEKRKGLLVAPSSKEKDKDMEMSNSYTNTIENPIQQHFNDITKTL